MEKKQKKISMEKEIERLQTQDYSILSASHGFMTNGALGGFKSSVDKMKYKFLVQFLLGLLAGIIVGLAYGSALVFLKDINIGGEAQKWVKTLMLGIIFPPAIWLITFLGGGLFTSHAVATIPTIKGLVPRKKYFSALGGVYLGNLCGTGAIVVILALAGVFNAKGDNTFSDEAYKIAGSKLYDVFEAMKAGRAISAGDVFLTIMYVFFSGILCNLLVSSTLPITSSTKSRGTASAVMFFAVFYFVTAGYQHSPANSFFLWTTMIDAILGHHENSWQLFGLFIGLNLIPAAIGNWLSGGILLPGILYLTQQKYVDILFDKIKLENYETGAWIKKAKKK